MNGKQIFNLAGATLLAGGLFVGGAGWADAQQHRHGADDATSGAPGGMADVAWHEDMGDAMHDIMDEMMPGMMDEMMSHMMGGGMMGGGMMSGMGGDAMADQARFGPMGGATEDHFTQMQATAAEALGLTVDEFQDELAAGKTVPQIAEEQDVDLTELHDALMDEFGGRAR